MRFLQLFDAKKIWAFGNLGEVGLGKISLSGPGNPGLISAGIQINEIVATVCLHLPGNLLHVEIPVLSYWTLGLNRLALLSLEILKVIESETRVDFK